MLARTVLTLLIFTTTSTVAVAREPLQPGRAGYAGGLAPALLAARAADPLTEPVYSEPTTTEPITTEPLSTPPPQNIRPPQIQASEWERERKKLQAKTAVTWVLTGIGAAGVAVPLAMLRACDEADRTRVMDCSQERQTAGIAAPIFGALALASIIPAIVYSTRLSRHNRYSGMARLGFSPGGVMLRF